MWYPPEPGGSETTEENIASSTQIPGSKAQESNAGLKVSRPNRGKVKVVYGVPSPSSTITVVVAGNWTELGSQSLYNFTVKIYEDPPTCW